MHFPNCWGMCLGFWLREVLAGTTDKRPKHVQLPQKGRAGFVLSALGGNDASFALDDPGEGRHWLCPSSGAASLPCTTTWLGGSHREASCASSSTSAWPGAPALPKMSIASVAAKGSTAGVAQGTWGPCQKPAVSGEHQHLGRDTKKWHNWKQDYFCSSGHPCVLLGRPHRAGLSSLWFCSGSGQWCCHQDILTAGIAAMQQHNSAGNEIKPQAPRHLLICSVYWGLGFWWHLNWILMLFWNI